MEFYFIIDNIMEFYKGIIGNIMEFYKEILGKWPHGHFPKIPL